MGLQEVVCPAAEVLKGQDGSGAVWDTWQKFSGVSIQQFSKNRPSAGAVLADIESDAPMAALPTVPDFTRNRTGEVPITGIYADIYADRPTTPAPAPAPAHRLAPAHAPSHAPAPHRRAGKH